MSETIYYLLYSLVSGTLTSFRDDLDKHDRADIVQFYPGVPFLHFVGPLSTQLIMLHNPSSPAFPPKGETAPYIFGKADREWKVINGIGDLTRAITSGQYDYTLAHYYNGAELVQINLFEARAIAEMHVEKCLREWRAE